MSGRYREVQSRSLLIGRPCLACPVRQGVSVLAASRGRDCTRALQDLVLVFEFEFSSCDATRFLRMRISFNLHLNFSISQLFVR